VTLQQKQHEFSIAVAHFLIWLDSKGYEVTFGEAHRPLWVAKYYAANGQGIEQSLHTDRLAIDLNLFKKGVYLLTVDELMEPGEYWESMTGNGLVMRWGGQFKVPDVLHFSVEHDGRA